MSYKLDKRISMDAKPLCDRYHYEVYDRTPLDTIHVLFKKLFVKLHNVHNSIVISNQNSISINVYH